ncbi:hypothetical protein D3C87_1898450 [compost metagenome]
MLAHPVHDLVAAHVGQLPVNDQQVEHLVTQRAQEVRSGGEARTRKAGLLEQLSDLCGLAGVVLHGGNSHTSL